MDEAGLSVNMGKATNAFHIGKTVLKYMTSLKCLSVTLFTNGQAFAGHIMQKILRGK